MLRNSTQPPRSKTTTFLSVCARRVIFFSREMIHDTATFDKSAAFTNTSICKTQRPHETNGILNPLEKARKVFDSRPFPDVLECLKSLRKIKPNGKGDGNGDEMS